MNWQRPWNYRSRLRPCLRCGQQYTRDSVGCPNCAANNDAFNHRENGANQEKRNDHSKEMRPSTFQLPENSLKDRIVDVVQMSFEIVKSSLRESWLGHELRQESKSLTLPSDYGREPPVLLGELYRLHLSNVRSHSIQLTDIAAKVPELDYLSCFFYEDLVRTSRPADFASWCSSIAHADRRLFEFIKPHSEEVYCRGKALFIGLELKASGVWRFKKWNTCLLSQLNHQEREFIRPFTKQIHKRTNEILLENTGSKLGVQVTTQQRRTILAGLALILLMLFVPPWKSSGGLRRGYGILLAPPRGAASIDLSRLFVQCTFVVLLTGIVFVLQNRDK
jgi:hypothetical protein